MAIENFSTYTEVDTNNKLTVTATKADGVDVDSDEDVYLYKDYTADYFDALDVDFETYIVNNAVDFSVTGMGITNTVGDFVDLAATDLVVHWYAEEGTYYRLYLDRGVFAGQDFYLASALTLYYCTLTRAAGNDAVVMTIYSDAARTNLLDTLSVAGYGTVKWRYAYGFINRNAAAPGKRADVYIQNLDLGISHPVLVTPATLALALTTYAPSILTPVVVTPPTLALALTTYAPTITTGEDIVVTPSTLALTITTYAPTIWLGRYKIEVDWNNDGDFDDTYDDITSDVTLVSYSRGKSDELGKAEVGQLSLTVNNAAGKYTPGYGGVISALLLPKRPIRMRATQSGTVYNLFYGFIEEIIPHPHLTEQDCIITAVDGIDFLSRHDMSTILYKDTGTGAIHTAILDDAGWSAAMRTIDTGQDTVPYWYGQDVKSRFAQEEIDDSEQGFSYISGNGYFNFEGRHHRSSATHQTSQATFTNTMAYITYSLNPKNVYNIIKVRVTPWEVQSIAELWRLDEVPSIPAGETLVWWGDASVSGVSVFVDAWTTPASTTDYTANSLANGTGTDMTADVAITTTKFAKTIKLSIKNNGAVPAFLTLLKARGTYYDDLTKVTRKAEDSTSQTAYQKRTLEIDGKYMTNAVLAQDLAAYSIGKYKDPRAELSMTIMNQDATNLTQILSREISDRITVVNTKLGINSDYFIDYMEHNISQGGKLHTATYRLADTINEDFWCLDYSALASTSAEGQTKLGY